MRLTTSLRVLMSLLILACCDSDEPSILSTLKPMTLIDYQNLLIGTWDLKVSSGVECLSNVTYITFKGGTYDSNIPCYSYANCIYTLYDDHISIGYEYWVGKYAGYPFLTDYKYSFPNKNTLKIFRDESFQPCESTYLRRL